MKLKPYIIVVSICTLSMPAVADSSVTQDFINKASISNEFELESSKLALEKSQDKDIKGFAQQMIGDHTKIGENLKTTLNISKSDTRPKDKLDDKHQKIFNKLESASTDDFNKKYIDTQTDAHKEAVSLFSDYSKNGDDPALKDLATSTLPTLQEHLEHIQQIRNKR